MGFLIKEKEKKIILEIYGVALGGWCFFWCPLILISWIRRHVIAYEGELGILDKSGPLEVSFPVSKIQLLEVSFKYITKILILQIQISLE